MQASESIMNDNSDNNAIVDTHEDFVDNTEVSRDETNTTYQEMIVDSEKIIGPLEMIAEDQIVNLNSFINSLNVDSSDKQMKQFLIIYAGSFVTLQIVLRIYKRLCELFVTILIENNILLASLFLSGLISFMINSDYAKRYLKRRRPFIIKG